LIDAYRKDQYGGTGHVADWSIATKLAQQYPILLAGGLTPDNVVEAIRQVKPWGVDVASGVEISPGKKDAAKMRAFVKSAKQLIVNG
jgi:phosphoribosylanthranilate isomerase